MQIVPAEPECEKIIFGGHVQRVDSFVQILKGPGVSKYYLYKIGFTDLRFVILEERGVSNGSTIFSYNFLGLGVPIHIYIIDVTI